MYIAFGLILLCLFVMGFIHAAILRARARVAVVFRHIGLVVQQNLPLSAGLYYAALSESGPQRGILARTSRLLETGVPLSQALTIAYPTCPGLPISVLRTAEAAGTLPSALRELNDHFSRKRLNGSDEMGSRWIFLIVLAIVYCLMFYGICFFITPRFQAIFADFESPIPLFTREVLAANPFSNATPTTVWGKLDALALYGLTLLTPLAILFGWVRLLPRRMGGIGVISIMVDYLRWHLWPWRAIDIARGCVHSLPILRLSTAAGWSLPDAIGHGAEVETNHYWQQQWRQWSQQIREGQNPVQAARSAGLPAMFVRHLAMGIRDSDLEAPLYHAESYYSTLLQRWRKLSFQLLWPLGTIAMGVLVGSFCMALVLTVKSLVDYMCAMIG